MTVEDDPAYMSLVRLKHRALLTTVFGQDTASRAGRGHDRQAVNDRLADEQAIEWIAMQ